MGPKLQRQRGALPGAPQQGGAVPDARQQRGAVPGKLLVPVFALVLASAFWFLFWLPSVRAAQDELQQAGDALLLKVRVVTAGDQLAVAGALVRWLPQDSDAQEAAAAGMESRTGADGRARLLVPARGRYRLEVDARAGQHGAAERSIRFKIGSQRIEWLLSVPAAGSPDD